MYLFTNSLHSDFRKPISSQTPCHDLGGGCLAFVVLEHMAFCFDSSPCAPLSSRSCSAHLVILFANSPFPPALYSILIISSFQNALVSAFFLSVRKHLFCSSDYLSAVVLADFVLLYFSSPVGLALLFLHPFFYTLTCLYRTLVGSLPWFFTVRVLVSSRHPSRSSLLASSASPGSQRRLFIAFSPPLCPAGSAEAGLCSARRGSELLAIGECQLVDFWD